MTIAEQAIFTNMCMVCDDAGNVLVQDRKDPTWGGICFPGGHVEPGEAFVTACIREVYEESGLTIENLILCGTKQFQTDDGARYVILFYKTNRFSGTLRSSEEGEMLWVKRSDLHKYRLAPDMEGMLQVFEDDSLSEFYYYKDDGKWKYRLL